MKCYTELLSETNSLYAFSPPGETELLGLRVSDEEGHGEDRGHTCRDELQ